MSYESGRLINFLLKHRMLRTKIPAGKRARPEEKTFARLFTEEMPGHERGWFEDLLAGMGFALKPYKGGVIRGIPRDGIYYILIRDCTEESTPSWVSPDDLYKLMELRTQETRTETKLWTFVVWMSLLSLMYTKMDRAPEQVSKYLDVEFEANELVQTVRAFVDNIKNEADELPDNNYVKFLCSEQGQDISFRVGRFLNFMTSINHLDFFPQKDGKQGEGIYSQTLIGAAEIEQQFERGLEHLIPQDELNLSTLSHIMMQEEDEDAVEVM